MTTHNTYTAYESECLAFASPPDAKHAEALRRAFEFGMETIQPAEYAAEFAFGGRDKTERERKKAERRARREDRRARNEVEAKLANAYGIGGLLSILAWAMWPALSALVQFALKAFFDWLWSKRANSTFLIMVADCKAAIG